MGRELGARTLGVDSEDPDVDGSERTIWILVMSEMIHWFKPNDSLIQTMTYRTIIKVWLISVIAEIHYIEYGVTDHKMNHLVKPWFTEQERNEKDSNAVFEHWFTGVLTCKICWSAEH